jgi:hypothetical protein
LAYIASRTIGALIVFAIMVAAIGFIYFGGFHWFHGPPPPEPRP